MNKIKLEIAGLSYSQTQSGAYALVLSESIGKRRLPIIIGGSQDLTLAMYDAYQSLEQSINTCSIDYSLDIGDIEEEVTVSYDYLINMQIRSLTKKKIDELNKLHETKLGVYNELVKKSEKELWMEDLTKFEKVYKEEMKEYEKRYKH